MIWRILLGMGMICLSSWLAFLIDWEIVRWYLVPVMFVLGGVGFGGMITVIDACTPISAYDQEKMHNEDLKILKRLLDWISKALPA